MVASDANNVRHHRRHGDGRLRKHSGIGKSFVSFRCAGKITDTRAPKAHNGLIPRFSHRPGKLFIRLPAPENENLVSFDVRRRPFPSIRLFIERSRSNRMAPLALSKLRQRVIWPTTSRLECPVRSISSRIPNTVWFASTPHALAQHWQAPNIVWSGARPAPSEERPATRRASM